MIKLRRWWLSHNPFRCTWCGECWPWGKRDDIGFVCTPCVNVGVLREDDCYEDRLREQE